MARISRRRLLTSGVAAGVLAASGMPTWAMPKAGGVLRLALGGADPSDSWDARGHVDGFMITLAHGAVFDCLTEVAATGELVGELAESWEASADATVWTFSLRKGVTFHDGTPFGADDVIASLSLHRDSGSPAAPLIAPIIEMTRLTPHQVRFVLDAGNADFPFLMSDYHLLIYPAGNIAGAMAQGIGTGLYRVENFVPGRRAALTRVPGHYKDGRAGWFERIEAVAMNDGQMRMAALVAGEADAVDRAELQGLAALREDPQFAVLDVQGNRHLSFPMLTNLTPFQNVAVRRALKHAVDRDAMLQTVLLGHGTVGNDHPIGPANQYLAADLAVNAYDPEKARALLARAGLEGLRLGLSATGEGVAAARAYQAAAAPAGIAIDVVAEAAEGYWSNVWREKPWCASHWAGRVTEDWMFRTAYGTGAAWNDTGWDDARFQALMRAARADFDSERRREIYGEMQRQCSAEGGTVIPVFANFVDAHSTRLSHAAAVGNVFGMDSARIAERWWFA